MKYLIALLALTVFVGCTDKKSPVETNVVGLKAELREAQYSLAACESKLSANNSSSFNNQPEVETPSAPAEPEYETITYYEVDGTKCYSTNEGDEASTGNAPRCGRSFWDCKDGVVRECMNNIKYKLKEEQKLIEQE